LLNLFDLQKASHHKFASKLKQKLFIKSVIIYQLGTRHFNQDKAKECLKDLED